MAYNVNGTVNVSTDKILQGAGKMTLDGIDLGSFRDGITHTYNETHAFTRSDYALGEIDGEVTGAELSVNTILEQSTAQNICIAMGGNTSSSSSSSSSIVWDFGPEMGVHPKVLVVTAMSEKDKTKARRITYHRVIRIGQTAMSFRRGTEVLLPVSFKCLLNASGKFWRLEDPVALEDL